MNLMNDISSSDPEIADMLLRELKRQEEGIELIPSENYTYRSVLQTMGSVFTNKYSEGYPKKRYYGGNEIVDEVEILAIERAKKLFGAEHANVQPYSGSPANQAVFFALLNLKDKFLGFSLTSGGHLTHGSHVNFQEIAEEVDAYQLADISHISGLIVGGAHESPVPHADVVTTTTHKSLRGPRGAIIMCKTEDRLHEIHHPEKKTKNGEPFTLARLIDSAVFPGLQGGPHDHATAAKAVAFAEAMKPEFKDYAKQIVKNAKVLADELMSLGIKLVTNGTDNHLILIDLRPEDLTGKGGPMQTALDEAGITLNKNTVPYEPSSPFHPSGLRLGTPAITSRGMKESEMKVIAEGLAKVIKAKGDSKVNEAVKQDILELTKQFPLYPGLSILK